MSSEDLEAAINLLDLYEGSTDCRDESEEDEEGSHTENLEVHSSFLLPLRPLPSALLRVLEADQHRVQSDAASNAPSSSVPSIVRFLEEFLVSPPPRRPFTTSHRSQFWTEEYARADKSMRLAFEVVSSLRTLCDVLFVDELMYSRERTSIGRGLTGGRKRTQLTFAVSWAGTEAENQSAFPLLPAEVKTSGDLPSCSFPVVFLLRLLVLLPELLETMELSLCRRAIISRHVTRLMKYMENTVSWWYPFPVDSEEKEGETSTAQTVPAPASRRRKRAADNRANHSGLTRALAALRLTSRPCSQTTAEDADVLPPFRIHRTSTSVLEAIASTIRRPPGYHPDVHPADPLFFKNARAGLFNHTLEYKLKGRQSARYIIDNSIAGDIVPLRTEQPRIAAFDPRITASQVAEMPSSEETLVRLIAMGNASSAWKMYSELGAETVSSETRLKLLDLLCAHNSRSRNLTEIDPLDIFIEKRQPTVTLPFRQIQRQSFPTWASEGFAEKLFKTLSDEEKGPGYRAMIRGLVRHGDYEQALKMHREMVGAGYSGDLKSYNAALMCVHTVTPFTWKKNKVLMSFHPWRAGLDLLYEMRDTGISPDVESFNSLIFSIAFSLKLGKTKTVPACKTVISLLKEMKALDMPPNLGTLTNVLRLADHVADAVTKISTSEAKPATGTSTPGTENPPWKQERFEMKAPMSAILDYVIEEMSKDKGRKRFGSEFDMEVLLLIDNAKFSHKRPLDIALKLHYLLRDSPGLAVRQSKRNLYLSKLLSYVCKYDAASAVDILEDEVNYVVHFRTPEKIKYLDAYANARPERMHNLLKAMVHQTVIEEDFVACRLLFVTLFYVADSYPFCRSSVLDALDALWTRVSRDWQTFAILNESFYSNLLFILLPADVSSEVETAALDLGVAVFNGSKSKDEVFSSAHRMLHLTYALLNAGRSAEGISILQTMIAKQRTVFEEAIDQFDDLVDKIAEFPEIVANEELSAAFAKHKDSKHLYIVTNEKEKVVDKKVIENALTGQAVPSRPYRRMPENRADQRKPGRGKKPWRPRREGEKVEFEGGSPRRRERREDKRSEHYLGFPTTGKAQGRKRNAMLPKLKTDVPVTELGSEETWPDLTEDTSSSSSSSSSDEE